MKFCYLDESGTGSEPFAVMVGIIVDAQRMHVSKREWNALLKLLSEMVGKNVPEIHTRDFYSGNGVWRNLSGDLRSRIITAILQWLNERKHLIVCSAIDKGIYEQIKTNHTLPEGIDTLWKCLGLHIVLSIQKAFQKEEKNKGNTLLVFDEEKREEFKFASLINNPPAWTDQYYGRLAKKDHLDQIIDVPFFTDSQHVGLVQMADFAAFFLRRYIEIKTGLIPSRYKEEKAKIDNWISSLCKRHIPKSATYPQRGRNYAHDFFWSIAPDCIRAM